MRAKVLILFMVCMCGGCKTNNSHEKLTNLIQSQQVEYKSDYSYGWNAALENLKHHLYEYNLD